MINVTRRQWPPALMTMLTLTCGFAALEAARSDRWLTAALLIMLAALADGLDGTLARALHGVCDMGAQLDSLADVVAFGVAPAFIFVAHTTELPPGIRFGVALAFVLAGAFRDGFDCE